MLPHVHAEGVVGGCESMLHIPGIARWGSKREAATGGFVTADNHQTP